MSTVGYARTSTIDQRAGLADQVAQLQQAGCERIWQEHASALDRDRIELGACLAYLREGDTFVVTKPDRLARSVRDMLAIIDTLRGKLVDVRILSIGADTTTATGKLILTILAGVAEMEREIMLERQRAGIAKAQAEGKYKGRPRVMTVQDVAEVRAAIDAGGSPSREARRLGVSRATLYRALQPG